MRKRFSTTDIDRFFTTLKEQPPIYNEEKVHQLINSPAAKARLKGKNNNLLKFTIMTTIFAVIVSAVLMWSGEKTENQVSSSNPDSYRDQDTRQLDKETNLGDNRNASNIDNRLIAMADLNKATTDVETSNSQVANNEQLAANNQEKSIEPAQQSKQKPLDFDPTTIQPMDGSQFIIKADKALLEKLGFTIKGDGIYYQNNTPESGFVTRHIYNSPKRSFYYSMGTPYLSDSTIVTKNDFYLKMVTYVSGQTKDYSNGFYSYEMANDTLLPILIPVGLINNNELNDVIYWFRITDKLMEITNMSSDLKEKIKRAILSKRECPEANIVDYQSKPTLSKTEFIELNAKELKPLGLYKEGDVYKLKYRKNKSTIGERFIDIDIVREIENKYQDSINYFFIPVVTDTFGLLKSIEGNFNFENLIPVLARREIWEDKWRPLNLVLWFEPTLSFLDALPKEIGDKLKLEYNYITAEDKSSLVKPECKYFDECKNTLKVSSFKVYPNPANNTAIVSFTLPEAIDGRITLVDLAGRERQMLKPQTCFSKGSHRIDVDVSSVPEGIYLLTLYSDKGVQTQRLIVAR